METQKLTGNFQNDLAAILHVRACLATVRRVGKHETSYARFEPDLYPTPEWVIGALADHVDLRGLIVCEPAWGDPLIVEALRLYSCALQGRAPRSPGAAARLLASSRPRAAAPNPTRCSESMLVTMDKIAA